jgi:drug/metabolite transporter (DMT)-like permease
VFGWLIFGDVPQTSIVIGAGLIVLSGLYIFFRENALKRRQARTANPPLDDIV